MEISIENAVNDVVGREYSETCEKFAHVVACISKDLAQVYRIDKFFDLHVSTVCQILSNDDLQILTEVDVFRVAIKWLSHAIDERWQFIRRVLTCVRFGVMTEKELWKCHELNVAAKGIKLDYCPVIANIIEEESRVPLNTTTTAPRTCFSDKKRILLKTLSNRFDKRYHIFKELIEVEREYVESLRILNDKYMAPLKIKGMMEESIVDKIFYMFPELLAQHSSFLEVLESVWQKWDARTTVGDVFMDTFSKQTWQETYMSFLDNNKLSSEELRKGLLKKSLRKFLEKCRRDCGSKWALKDLFALPGRRIPRYELLIRRLAQYTPTTHPDFPLLIEAERELHEFAIRFGVAKERLQYGNKEAGRKKDPTQKNRLVRIVNITNYSLPLLNEMITCLLWK